MSKHNTTRVESFRIKHVNSLKNERTSLKRCNPLTEQIVSPLEMLLLTALFLVVQLKSRQWAPLMHGSIRSEHFHSFR